MCSMRGHLSDVIGFKWVGFRCNNVSLALHSHILIVSILFLIPALSVPLSDWEVHRKHSILSDLQLPVQDHPGSAVSMHQVSLRPAVPRPDDPSAGVRGPAGEVGIVHVSSSVITVWGGRDFDDAVIFNKSFLPLIRYLVLSDTV